MSQQEQLIPPAAPRAANLNLRAIDHPQTGESLLDTGLGGNSGFVNGQPLSPTQTSSNKTSSRLPKENGKQKQLKGPPQHVGLTTIEYGLEAPMAKSAIAIKEITQNDVQVNYLKDLYEDQGFEWFPFKSISEQFAPNELYQRVEVTLNLPFDMGVEQVELQIASHDLFTKYLKLLKVETTHSDRPIMHLKGGFYDSSKRILEVNTCGHTNQLKLVFLYNFDNKPRRALETGLKAPRGESAKLSANNLSSSTGNANNVSDRIKNEIIPLLNVGSNDDEMDELDDEVAMISNKKSQEEAIIATDDIMLEIKASAVQSNKGKSNKPAPKGSAGAKTEEEYRNFNTMPRNYGEQQQQLQQIAAAREFLENNDVQANNNTLAYLEQEIFENSDHHSSQNQLTQQQQLGEVVKLIQRSIGQIKVIGFNLNQIPAITSLTTFMNNSFLLKKEAHMSEALEFDFVIGVLMVSSKRFIQAVEIFRKIQTNYLNQIDLKTKDAPNSKNPAQSKNEINKFYVKCALLELLTAESMCQAPQINDKLICMKRMCDLFQGKTIQSLVFAPQVHLMDDPYTTILKLLPVLLKFVLMCVTHKKEIVRMASMKLLEFVLETKGCSLDASMVFILKAILTTYPSISVNATNLSISQQQNSSQISNQQPPAKEEPQKTMSHQDSFCLNNLTQSVQEYFQYPNSKKQQAEQKIENIVTEYKSIKEPASGFQSALKNVYNHVLETYISVLSSISSHILHQLFYEVIIPTVNSTQSLSDVKIFAIKIAEKIITICQGDLVLSKSSLEYFLQTVSQKQQANSSNDQQLFYTNLRNLWSSIRTKVFANYSQKGMKSLIDWLVDKMSLIAQNAGINNKDIVVGLSGAMNEDQIDEQSNPDISKLEITEEEGNQLQQIFDIISVISVSRKKNEEEANSHIKIKQDYIIELYVLINPLLFWLDFSVEREERFGLFKSVYQTIKDVLENLPPKRIDIDLLQIMIPILQRTTDFLKNNSPSLSMLKVLDMVLRDIKAGGFCQMQSDLQYFFLEMLNNYVNYISYCLYEEVFSVFDKLLSMCADVINEKVLSKCIVALVDKYTMKSKSHKNSLSQFMKMLLEVKVRNHHRGAERRNHSNNNNLDSDEHDMLDEDQISVHSKNNYFEIMCNVCFLSNEDPSQQPVPQQQRGPSTVDSFKTPTDFHDLYVDKIQFFIDSLQLLAEIHINLFTSLIMHPKFKVTLLALLGKGELSLRLKCHEILEVVTNYYSQFNISKTVYELALPQSQQISHLGDFHKKKGAQSESMEVEYINQERLYLSQIVVQAIKMSLDQKHDSYLQFNSLILLDFLFQNLLPVPSFQNELMKDKVNGKEKGGNTKSNQNQSINNYSKSSDQNSVLDLETAEINETTPEFEVTQRQYMLMRLNLIFKLWPYVTQALNSAWSNIRSICYGLICSMLKIDIRDFQQLQSNSQAQNMVNQQFLVKLKQIVLPMLVNLLSSKESESKAGGLNILGSFCGLSYDFSTVKISKNLDFFRKNSQFISLSIWQLVFDLQDDWDITIKEASVVLIQLCAPRDAVKYFDKVKRERENIKFQNMMNRYGMGGPNGDQSSRLSSSRGHVDVHMQFLNSAASMNGDNEDMLSGIPQPQKDKTGNNILSFLSGTADDMSLVFQMDQHNQNQQNQLNQLNASAEMLDPASAPQKTGIRNEKKVLSSTSEEILRGEEVKKSSYLGDLDDALQYQEIMEQENIEGSHFNFFVDKYADEQIQEIISIFRNDFKPPKNLWIEKNPSVAFNSPDYYAEIFSQAIDQFNQQQMQLQQQQQVQLQIQLSSSPKSALSKASGGGSVVDALEDDLVKKYENEKKEKERIATENGGAGPNNFMIFERHFEDKDIVDSTNTDANQVPQKPLLDEEIKKEDLSSTSSNNQPNSDTCSIDAEPYQFLDSPKLAQGPSLTQSKEKKKEPKQNLSLQILDDDSSRVPKSAKGPNKDKLLVNNNEQQPSTGRKSKEQHVAAPIVTQNKKTTDELIEEYERKIIKTKSLLEEEKKRVAKKDSLYQDEDSSNGPTNINIVPNGQHQQDLLNNLTPEFKGKPIIHSHQSNENIKAQNEDNNGPPMPMMPNQQSHSRDSKGKKAATQPPQLMQSNQLQSYLTDFSQKGLDNAKLLKQIKHCFNDTSYVNNYGLGAVTMSTTPQGGVAGAVKSKQKLNKSYENLLAANRNKVQNEVMAAKNLLCKKNLSTSPRRGSSSGKKSGSQRLNKKKFLQHQQQQLQQQSQQQPPQLQNLSIQQPSYPVQDQANMSAKSKSSMYNMKDLNFFIKTIEKDISDKFNKMNIKDFNSMPTTPTSILKKVEDQMKALAQVKDIKAQMSNTCPNIAQVLGTLDSNKVNNQARYHHHAAGTETHRQFNSGAGLLLQPGHQMGSNFQTINTTTPMMNVNGVPSHNSLSAMSYNSASGNNIFDSKGTVGAGGTFSFSKTQKIDMKDATKGIFSYQIPMRDQQHQQHPNHPHGATHRELSSENRNKNSLSPLRADDKQHYANLLKQNKHHKKSGKRSRGSTDKYLLLGGGMGVAPQQAATAGNGPINYNSSSSSYTKLNKSANNIQATVSSTNSNNPMIAPLSVRRKEQPPSSSSLSQQLINSFAKVNNMSPNNKKILQQLVKQQFGTQPSSAGIPLSVGLNPQQPAHDDNQLSKRGSAHAALITQKNNNHHQVSASSQDNKTPNKSAHTATSHTQRNKETNNNISIELSPINGAVGDRKK